MICLAAGGRRVSARAPFPNVTGSASDAEPAGMDVRLTRGGGGGGDGYVSPPTKRCKPAFACVSSLSLPGICGAAVDRGRKGEVQKTSRTVHPLQAGYGATRCIADEAVHPRAELGAFRHHILQQDLVPGSILSEPKLLRQIR